MIVFCINGIALSGKDSFVNRLKAIKNKDFPDHSIASIHRQPVKCISTIDPVKEIYRKFFGWNGEKSPVHRKNLNNLKKYWIEVSNGPIEWTRLQIQHTVQHTEMLFVMVREFSEMQATKELATSMGLLVYTVEVVRPGVPIPPIEQEFLDSHPKHYKYDITIVNPTADTFPSLPILDAEVDKFLTKFDWVIK